MVVQERVLLIAANDISIILLEHNLYLGLQYQCYLQPQLSTLEKEPVPIPA